MGGAMGLVGCKVVVRAYERALADNAPIVGLWHSGGARLAEGVISLHAVGEIFHAMTQAVRQDPADLGGARSRGRWGRLRTALTDIVILGPEAGSSSPGPTWSGR